VSIMNYLFLLVLLILSAFLLSVILVKGVIVITSRLGIVDKPSQRRAHARITPRGGGIAFVITFALLMPAFEYLAMGIFTNSINILQIFLPLALVSLWDDIYEVPILLRLLI